MNLNKKIVKLRKELNMTLQELADKVGVNASTVQRWEKNDIKNMRRDKIGLLAKALETTPDYLMGWVNDPGLPASLASSELEPIAKPEILTKKIPLMGTTAAGVPIEAIQEYEYIDIATEVDCDVCLRVKGDSMIDAGIFNGDIALIRVQDDLENGTIGVVIINGEATLKEFYHYTDVVILRPRNPKYKDFVYTAKNPPESIRIFGRCVGVIHKV